MRASFAVCMLFAACASAATITFTGNATLDFGTVPASAGVVIVTDPPKAPDVGLPMQVVDGDSTIVSGWDINRIFFHYDRAADILSVGIECYGICGDADGRSGPDAASAQLLSIGGTDLPDLGNTESFALIFSFATADPYVSKVAPTHIIGVPGGKPLRATAELPCTLAQTEGTLTYSMFDCFGLYTYDNAIQVGPAYRFLSKLTDWNDITNYGQASRTPLSSSRPHLEWSVPRFSELKALAGFPFPTAADRYGPFNFWLSGFAGSFQDAGIGEEYIPDQIRYLPVNFTCAQFDACGVCLGDGSTCKDCKGTPGGKAIYDLCDICDGDSTSCKDCKGMVFGTAKYDTCDVCGGTNSTCKDCKGVPNGPAVYDKCDVCAGDGTSCVAPPPVAVCSSDSEVMTSEGSCESVSDDDDDSDDDDSDDDDSDDDDSDDDDSDDDDE